MDETDPSSVNIDDKWTILANLIDKGATEVELHDLLNELTSYSFKSGLSSAQLNWAIALLKKLTGRGNCDDVCVSVLCLLIPAGPLTISQTDKLLNWFQLSFLEDSVSSKHFTVWLLVALRIKLISKEHLQNAYYSTFFRMLVNNPKSGVLSLVLRNLVKPFHITEFDFARLHDFYVSHPASRKNLVVLLQTYASIKPEFAKKFKLKKLIQAERVKVRDKNVNASLQRILTLNIMNTSVYDLLDCHEENAECNENPFWKTPPAYGTEGGTKITSLSSLEDLIKHYDSVVVPDNIISILKSNCGQYYVAFASLEFTTQLEEQVEAILNGLLNNRPHSGVDCLNFLKSLAKTEAACSQGMPSVSRFLSNYLICWDGHKYEDAIIDLIPWMYFNSFEDLDNFMKTLFNVFVTATIESKIQLVEALGDLYVNLATSYQVGRKSTIPFIGCFPSWMLNNYFHLLEIVTLYIKQFIYTGFVSHGAEPSFLIKALILYYKIFLIERKLNLMIFTVMPQIVVLLSQTSSCISVINLMCKILTLYLKNNEILEPDSTDSQTLYLIKSYCKDTASILLHGIENNKLESLLLGRLFSEEDALEFRQKLSGIENLMAVPKHFAFAATLQDVAKNLKVNIKHIKKENYVDILDVIAPDCASLIRETDQIMDVA